MNQRSLTPVQPRLADSEGLLQRQCACGQHTIAGGECDACRQDREAGIQRSARGPLPAQPAPPPVPGRNGPRVGHDLALVPAHAAPERIQAKLSVNRPGDEFEQEADRVASAAVRQPAGAAPAARTRPGARGRLSLRATPGAAIMDDRKKEEDEEEEEKIQAKEAPGQSLEAPSGIEGELEAMRGDGQPLPGDLRDYYEPRLGHDLGQVRLHTGGGAAHAADSLNAHAFTLGQDVYFGAGRYQPGTEPGRELLAHELVHTVQQGGNGAIRRQIASETLDQEPLSGDQPGLALAEPPSTPGRTEAEQPVGERPAGAEGPERERPAAPGARPQPPERRAGERPSGPGPAPAPGAAAGPPAGAPVPQEGGEAAPPEPAQLDTTSSAGLLQSLATVPPTSFGDAMTTANQAAAQIQQQERSDLQASMPEIQSPSGLPRLSERPEAPRTQLPPGRAPEQESAGPRQEAPPETTHPLPSTPPPASRAPTAVSEPAPESGVSFWDWLWDTIRRFSRGLPTTDPALSTLAGERPRVDMTGDADPSQSHRQHEASNQEVAAHRADAEAATRADFGENRIYPTVPPETLRPDYTPTVPQAGRNGDLRRLQGPDPEVRAGVDRGAAPYLRDQVNQKAEEERQERAKQEEGAQQARDNAQRELDEETQRVRAQQEEQQRTARGEVSQARQQWQEQNRTIQQNYDTEANQQRLDMDRQVQDENRTTDTSVEQELGSAEQQAEADRRKTEEQAAAKKREAENKPRSFWDRVRGAVSDFFDAIKEAVNNLFNELRRRVKQLIEAAKRRVKGWIEAARRKIVGWIRGFGEALKGLVSIALFAFPEAAAKAREFIDGAVETAVDGVNAAAEALKQAADRVLDALGAALDFVLALYQKAYLAILSALQFIAVGLIDILERIGHLVDAARQMPDHFLGQASEELIGMDLTQPLPFERTEAPRPAAVAQAAQTAGVLPSEDVSALSKNTATETDLAVDQVAPLELDPQFLASLNLQDGADIEFGEINDPARTLAAVQADAAAQAGTAPAPEPAAPGTDLENVDVEGVEPGATPAAPSQTTAGPEVAPEPAAPEAVEDTEAQLQAMMDQPAPETCAKEASNQPADQSAVPDHLKIGPLTVGQRARYLLDQIIKGIKQWFSCNWPWLLAAAIGVLAVLVVAEILTGGAITAALPAIMELVAMILIGVAIIRVAAYVGEYLTKGWDGDIVGSAKSLARGLAIGAIELIFTLLFDLNSVIKAAKSGLTATLKGAAKTAKTAVKTIARSGRRVARAAVRTVRAPGRAAALVGRVAVRRGRLILQGVRRGFAQGVRSLDDLARRLWNTVRFRKFRITLRGRRIRLWGYINPWVLMAQGDLRYVDLPGVRVGERVTVGGRRGIAVGARGGTRKEASTAVQELAGLSRAERQAAYREFAGLTDEEIRAVLYNRETTAQLRRGIPGPQPPGFNAHHLVPREIRKNPRLRKFLDEIAYDIENGAHNGIMLPPNAQAAKSTKGFANSALHRGSHPNYTKRVSRRLTQLADAYEAALAQAKTPGARARIRQEALEAVQNYTSGLKSRLRQAAEKLD